MKYLISWLTGLFLVLACGISLAQDGAALYEDRCAGCHDNGVNRAPSKELFEAMLPGQVLNTIESGTMVAMALGLTPEDRRILVEHLTGKSLDDVLLLTPPAEAMCTSDPSQFSLAGPSWMGWGGSSTTNTRFQTEEAAQLSAADVPNLQVKWVFGLPGHIQSYGNPAVAGGRVF
jgi:polyvinyl alcohol dehydrogenase (cytochrome)